MRIIAGEWRGRRIDPPRGRDVRPTTDRVRESWMSAMGGRFDGLRVLDLFSGSGALGLELLSRGAAEAMLVERAAPALRSIRANVRALDAEERVRVVERDVFRFLEGVGRHDFDLAVADPPYEQGHAAALLEHFARAPFAHELWVEHRVGEPVPELPGLRSRRYGDTVISHLESRHESE